MLIRAPSEVLPGMALCNALTIDVEDYFQVSALEPYIARGEWDARHCRVEHNVDRILAMLEEYAEHATFFTLGWIAERYPRMVRRIVDGGHEVASHGFAHRRASEQSPEAFQADIHLAKVVLEDLTGAEVIGYRAPSFSIGDANPWAFDCIARAGYRYSSSVYPISHDHYGTPHAPRFAHDVREGLIEVPLTTMRLFGRNWPAAGGGYFRLMPYSVSRWMLSRVNRVDRQPAIFYFHPWEIDPAQPRVAGIDARTRFRHYVNLQRMEHRLRQLLFDFEWGRVDEVILESPLVDESTSLPRATSADASGGLQLAG
jgi:polysaccharide deacetylase family protein (PEP-CTERM system associated)